MVGALNSRSHGLGGGKILCTKVCLLFTGKDSLQLLLGYKNVLSVHQGQVDFLAGQEIFHCHLPRVQATYLPTK